MARFVGYANQQRFREVLRNHGFHFCDEEESRIREVQAVYVPLEEAWRREATAYSSVIAQPVAASTTDHETQGIGNTLLDDRSFWSSGPSTTETATESLVFQLTAPMCVVKFACLAVYRELGQVGAPLYPPLEVTFGIGTTPSNISTVTPRYPVPLDDSTHLYPIPASAAPGMFLRVEFHGKQQLQREDMQYYIAIRYVDALGEELPTSEAVAAVNDLLSTRQCTLPLLQGPRLADLQHELDSAAMLAAAQQDEQPGSSVLHDHSSVAPTPEASSANTFLRKLRSVIGSQATRLGADGSQSPSSSSQAAGSSQMHSPSLQRRRSRLAVMKRADLENGPGTYSGDQSLRLAGTEMVKCWGLQSCAQACDWEVDEGHDAWQYDEDWDDILVC